LKKPDEFKRIYTVVHNNVTHLVAGDNTAQARNHIADKVITVKLAGPTDIARLMSLGMPVEYPEVIVRGAAEPAATGQASSASNEPAADKDKPGDPPASAPAPFPADLLPSGGQTSLGYAGAS
jgi:hypothetical protein